MISKYDRCKGVLMGGFLGDAFGFAKEFHSHLDDDDFLEKKLLTGFSRQTIYTKINKLPDVHFEAGTITDDSIMTIELLTSLYLNEDKPKRLRRYYDMVKNGGEFANKTCGMFGKNTTKLFKTLAYNDNYEKQFEVRPPHYAKNKPQSNGCLMRCSPLSFGDFDVKFDVEITNPDYLCVDICETFVYMIKKALKGKTPKEVFDKGRNFCNKRKTDEIFECVENNEEFDTSSKGWICTSFYYALRALKKFEKGKKFMDVLAWIVKQGGDTDTNAAIAGNLLGGFIGFKAMLSDPDTRQNIDIITQEDDDIIPEKYRKVPKSDWKVICKRLKKIID